MSTLPCRLSAEDLAGSAPRAEAWWLLHVPGAWGPRVVDGLIPPERTGPRVRALAVRRVGRHPAGDARVVEAWFAAVGQPVLRWVGEPSGDVLAGLGALEDLAQPPVGSLAPDTDAPALLVCTNGRRDLCCGTAGREVATALADLPGVWECSHLGGHRFAPTALLLPSGWCLGGLTPDAARAALGQREPLLDPAMLRGRTDRAALAQVAEIAVRRARNLRRPDDITEVEITAVEITEVEITEVEVMEAEGTDVQVTGVEGTEHAEATASVVVRTRDGQRFDVALVQRATHPRPASCGAEPTVESVWAARTVVG